MKKIYIFEGIDCPSCAEKVESAICKINGVKQVKINFFTQKFTLETEDDIFENILIEVKNTAKKIERNFKLK